MQEKLIDILSRATAWMTAGEIAEAGNWRSHANVGVALAQMEKSNGNVERRKSPTKKMHNGMPATEWKLTEKTIAESTEPKMGRKPKHPPLEAPAVAQTKTIEQRAVEIAVDRNNKVADLEDDVRRHSEAHARITTEVQHFMTAVQQITGDAHRPATLDEAANLLAVTINNLRHRLESAETAVDSWLALAAEYECKSIPDLRVFITSSMSRIESMKQQIATLNEQLMTGEEEAVDVKEASFFAVFRPRRGLQRFKKLETAKVEAEVGARVDGRAELYAMFLVDVASKGAIWKGKASA